MFTFGAEIAPYHDFSLEDSLRALSELGFTHVNLWSSAIPSLTTSIPATTSGRSGGC